MRGSVSLTRLIWGMLGVAMLVVARPTLAQNTAVADVVGLRPGMSAQDAYNALKMWAHGGKVGVGMMPLPIAAKPVVVVMSAQVQDANPSETMTVWLTLPPAAQVVWAIRREMLYDEGKELLTATALDALRKKYGVEMDPRGYSWFFDEQGNRVDAAGPTKGNCNMVGVAYFNNVGPDPSAPLGASPLISSPGPATVCDQIINVTARLQTASPQNQYTRMISLFVQDRALARRNQEAYQAALANASRTEQNEKLNQAKQQKPPSF